MAVSPSLVAAIVQELKDEHAQVLHPLLGKLKEIADQIDADIAMPAEVIRPGLEIWARYLTEIRAEAVRRALGPLSSLNGPRECVQRLHELREEASVEKSRIPNLERLLKSYSSGQFGGRTVFLGVLRSSIESGRAWARYEEEYASRCLVQGPVPETEVSITQWLEQARALRGRLATEVQTFVVGSAVPVPVGAPS